MAFGCLANFVLDKVNHSTGQGRWSNFLVGIALHKTKMVIAYNSTKPNISSQRICYDGETVWEQQGQYFCAQGES